MSGLRNVHDVLGLLVLLLLYGLFIATAAAAAPGGDSAAGEAEALMSCFNAKYSPEPIRVEEYLTNKPSRSVRMQQIWWSKRQHRLPVTLFTHSDLSRLKSVEVQCRGYPGGVIAVAVWVPLIAGSASASPSRPRDAQGLDASHVAALRNATDLVGRMFQAMEAMEAMEAGPAAGGSDGGNGTSSGQEACVMRLMLLYELVQDDVMASLMPLNILRNAAMLAATTPLIGMVDADMTLNWGMSHVVLTNTARSAELQRRAVEEKVVWVIPIFDTDDKLALKDRMALAEAAVKAGPNAKADLIDMWRLKSSVFPYGSRTFTPGHAPTDCERWAVSATDYEIEYKEGYEPFILGNRKALPPYDSRFRGYFRDKIVNTAYVSRLGFRFRVLHDVWMVHRPHEPCMASYKYFWYHSVASHPTPLEKLVPLPNGTWVRGRAANNVHSLSTYDEAVEDMDAGTYRPVLNDPTVHCRSVLPWWQKA